jgi:hypothetical protein
MTGGKKLLAWTGKTSSCEVSPRFCVSVRDFFIPISDFKSFRTPHSALSLHGAAGGLDRDHAAGGNEDGGHGYLPDGRTTDKPIPLSLDVAPVFVPAGGVITIQSTGGTVK